MRSFECWGPIALLMALAAQPAHAALTVEDLTATSVTSVGPYYQDVADAIKDFSTGNYSGAYAHLESAKKSTPRLPPPEVMLARLYLDANLTAPAIAQLEKGVRRVPDDPEALILLAERAVAEGRATEAELLFQKAAPAVAAFQQNPKRQQDLQMRLNSGGATIDEAVENWEAAADKLQKMLALDPGNTAVNARLGRVLFRLNRGQDAYEQFKKAAADPKMPPPELAMATLFSDKAKAEQWLQNALKQNAKDLRTQVSAGHYRLRNNQIDEAGKHADAALAIDPNSFDANLLAGMIERIGGDYPAAIKHLGMAHLLAPAEPAIVNHLALALIELPDETSHQRALQFAELNAKQHPTYIEGLASLGWINYRLNRRDAAQRALTAALAPMPRPTATKPAPTWPTTWPCCRRTRATCRMPSNCCKTRCRPTSHSPIAKRPKRCWPN